MTSGQHFAIGAVSRLLGLSTHTLRKWEVRYAAVSPARSAGGDRRYSREDLDRLARLKALVDAGHSISTIAKLTDDELDERIGRQLQQPPADSESLRVAVIGRLLGQQLETVEERSQALDIVASVESAVELDDKSVDAIIVEVPALTEQTRGELRKIREQTGVDTLLIIYRFGSAKLADALSDPRTVVLSGPIGLRETERALRSVVIPYPGDAPALGLPPHRFSRSQLSDIAMMSPALACECPRHVAKLIIELSDFERYSEDCEINKPEDALIHNMLRRAAATSRAIFENALVDLAAYEDIDIGAA